MDKMFCLFYSSPSDSFHEVAMFLFLAHEIPDSMIFSFDSSRFNQAIIYGMLNPPANPSANQLFSSAMDVPVLLNVPSIGHKEHFYH